MVAIKITPTAKAEKYRKLTEKALKLIKISEGLSDKEKLISADFLQMAQNYYSDGIFFQKKKDYLTALASFSYAHAWLDAGVRARIFQADDDQLFTLP
jgi:hypothetical protein